MKKPEARSEGGFDETAEFLKKADGFLILSHTSPDGDTIGAAYALCLALRSIGKQAAVACSDPLPNRYGYLVLPAAPAFEPKTVVTADVADPKLLGKNDVYADKVDLCIDHHPSNTHYARRLLLRPAASSTCEAMAELLPYLGAKITPAIADCLYTGIATDSGCFRFSNTSADTLRTAAMLLDAGARSAVINKWLFDTVSRSRLEVEQLVLQTMEYHLDGQAALIVLSRALRESSGVAESEMEGFASIPARIEGVKAGITIREKEGGVYKISLRTVSGLDASAICSVFGGGGHAAAAGCCFTGKTLKEVKSAILAEVAKALGNNGRLAYSR